MLLLPLALSAAVASNAPQPPTARRAAPDTAPHAVPTPPHATPDSAQVAALCRAQAAETADRMPRVVPDTAALRRSMPRVVPDLSQYRMPRAPRSTPSVQLPSGLWVPCPPA